jgi:excinuclease ABC subunit B
MAGLDEQGIRVKYIHHNVDTMERMELLRDLRTGAYDVLVGINLLREGIDLPEVTLVAILDADKEGLLRSETSLIQTIGRAARNANGKVILYADVMTRSIKAAVYETERRRRIQKRYNEEHGITPQTIKKSIRELIAIGTSEENKKKLDKRRGRTADPLKESAADRQARIEELTAEMKKAAKELRFEEAAYLRDKIKELQAVR